MGPGWPQHSSSRVTRFHEVGRLVHALAGVSGLSDGSPSVRYSAQQCWERDAIIRFPFCIIESVDSICRGYLCTASGAGSVVTCWSPPFTNPVSAPGLGYDLLRGPHPVHDLLKLYVIRSFAYLRKRVLVFFVGARGSLGTRLAS